MLAPTFDQIEKAIGGRPPKGKKIRMSFYLNKDESEKLKSIASHQDISTSTLVRSLIQNLILRYI